MNKIKMGPRGLIYPMPAFLVGTNVDSKPNFMTVAWGGIANGEPPMISMAIRPNRYTHKGIRQSSAFSVNIPSTDMVQETDYCGIVSGIKVDKMNVCKFKVFYGKTDGAPLIEQCPVNLECKVIHFLNLGSHSLIIGEIEETHVSESCLTDNNPDVDKIKPLIYTTGTTGQARQYRSLGESLGKAYYIGAKAYGVGNKGKARAKADGIL
ncbi:flavin reductase family protein [Chloroflexota bacterium]